MKAGSPDLVASARPMNRRYQLLALTLTLTLLLYFYLNRSPPAPIHHTSNGECPVQNFAFIKTHKTGSSTMSNIALRYSENHQLNQLLGRYPSGTEYGNLHQKRLAPPPKGQIYNAFSMHADYDYHFLSSTLPSNTKFFTIIRHPVSRYLSGFRFFGLGKYDKTSFDKAVNAHLSANSGYLVNTATCEPEHCARIINSVASDLGFNFERYLHASNKTTVMQEFYSRISTELDLVLISEYYDLSLVLLARRFCWSFDDICYLKSLESTTHPHVTEETKQRVQDVQRVDWEIYQHYNRTFWEIVRKEEGIFEDVENFSRHNEEMKKKCFAGRETGSFKTWKYELTKFGETDFQCRAMTSRVLPFAHLLQKRNQDFRNAGPHQSGMLTLEDVYKKRELESGKYHDPLF